MIVARGLGQGGQGNIVSSGLGKKILEGIIPTDLWHRPGFSTMHTHDIMLSADITSGGAVLTSGGWVDSDIKWFDPTVGWIGRPPNPISDDIVSDMYVWTHTTNSMGVETEHPTTEEIMAKLIEIFGWVHW